MTLFFPGAITQLAEALVSIRRIEVFFEAHRALLCFNGFYWVLLGFTGFYWVYFGLIGFN